jgi:6,7-dimethyl-8-ribityllumazine synthase
MANFIFDREQNHSFLENAKIAIIVAYFYKDIGEKLLSGAIGTLKRYGIDSDNINVFYVPGAFEVPLMAKKLAQQTVVGTNLYDGIVTLGAVIQGATPLEHSLQTKSKCGVSPCITAPKVTIPSYRFVPTTVCCANFLAINGTSNAPGT